MTLSTIHLHASMDRYPQFLSSIRDEFPDDCEAIAEEIIDAELGDFCWDARIAERRICTVAPFEADDIELCEQVRILGYFRGKYLVATCIVDGKRHLNWMLKVRHFDALSDAEAAFLTAD
jgi:hypothetical protein